jgi:serine/threonine protein kinase/predicted Zn-dependent protease
VPAELLDAANAELATMQLAGGARPVAPPAVDALPRAGETVEGFEVLGELGRGAMGRVVLARQLAPVERLVVLKMGHYLSAECQRLAKLQHPNVVPVYSFHQTGKAQAVCMPFRGPLTLAHLVARVRAENVMTLDGKFLTTAISAARADRHSAVAALEQTAGETVAPAPTPNRNPFAALSGLAYVDAVLALVRQVVEGLRAAHAERIVHCDLKPANVLLADDGTAQLIDFGIAYDKGDAGSQQRLGGTRPYMSPEQLRSVADGELGYDERSDLYAVGVMLYELLTGWLPYESSREAGALESECAARFVPPHPVRDLNPRVPHGGASIIAKCLAPHLADRYQSAAQLLDDLDRQIARRPLKYAANVSRRERATNFLYRNRWALAAAAVLCACAGAFAASERRAAARAVEIDRLALVGAGAAFAGDSDEAEFWFVAAEADPAGRARARAAARRALDRFGAESDGWFRAPKFDTLDAPATAEYRRRTAALMLALAGDETDTAVRTIDPAARGAALARAAAWTDRAAAAHPDGDDWRAVWAQRALLARAANDPAAAERHARRAAALPRPPADAVVEARQLLAEGRAHTALPLLKAAAYADPQSFWGLFYLGACHQTLNETREAIAAYDRCVTLRPDAFGALFNRGRAKRFSDPAGAETDLDRAVAARPGWGAAHVERALARELNGNSAGALDDLATALELNHSPVAVLLLRSRIKGRMKDAAGADADFAAATKTDPTDELGWLARGQARVLRDPAAALADFEKALALNPRLVPALQAQAHLLSKAGKTRAAAEALSRLVDINPDAPNAWSGRAVMRARLGDRAGAHADAAEALKLSEGPMTKYQLAGAYALTAKDHPDDKREALSLLDAALRAGFGFEYLNDDKDLDPLRADPEFQKTVDAARKYRAALKKVD